MSDEDKSIRLELLSEFRKLPIEAFSRLRHFQPQIGCFNKCGFCSQAASSRIIEFDLSSLRNIIATIRAVSIENGIKSGNLPVNTIINGKLVDNFVLPERGLIANELERPGVIYCYLDNDPALYEKLDIFINLIYQNLGVKTRIATVGFSRKNFEINRVFRRLSSELYHCLAGIRLSISPYTDGWKNSKYSTINDFEKDISNFIEIFKEHFLSNKNGRKGACIELRFRPLIIKKDISIQFYKGYFVLLLEDKLFVSEDTVFSIPESKLINIEHNLRLNSAGVSIIEIERVDDLDKLLDDFILGKYSRSKKHILHKLSNEDGDYYVINAERTEEGFSFAKYFYPKTEKRMNSGMIDAERYFLNTLLNHLKRKNDFCWSDVDNVIEDLKTASLSKEIEVREYINKDILFLLESYIRILKMANLPAKAFFDKSITVDTGQICNLGRAFEEYQLIASRKDLPMTLNHERAFGRNSDLAKEGTVYRLAPANEKRKSNRSCLERKKLNINSFIIEELDLATTDSYDGQSKNVYEFSIENMHVIRMKDLLIQMIPGQI